MVYCVNKKSKLDINLLFHETSHKLNRFFSWAEEGEGRGGGTRCPPGSPFTAGRHGTIESAK